jgi:ketosteroid isomerase-like protein
MTQQVAYRFIEALSALEQDGEMEPILATFGEFCEIGTPINPEKLHGIEGARQFWHGYRTTFSRIRSTIRNIVIGDNSVALEWTADGVNRSGKEIHYDGVSVLDTSGSHITRFRTYFDAAAAAATSRVPSSSAGGFLARAAS